MESKFLQNSEEEQVLKAYLQHSYLQEISGCKWWKEGDFWVRQEKLTFMYYFQFIITPDVKL